MRNAMRGIIGLVGVIHLWLWRPLPVMVPGAGFNLALLVVLGLGWLLILAEKERAS